MCTEEGEGGGGMFWSRKNWIILKFQFMKRGSEDRSDELKVCFYFYVSSVFLFHRHRSVPPCFALTRSVLPSMPSKCRKQLRVGTPSGREVCCSPLPC